MMMSREHSGQEDQPEGQLVVEDFKAEQENYGQVDVAQPKAEDLEFNCDVCTEAFDQSNTFPL